MQAEISYSFVQMFYLDKATSIILFHKAIGNPCYIIPGADLSTPEKLNQLIKLVNYAQPILAKEGISLAYHNHSFEYDLMPNGVSAFAMLEKNTRIDFELDTYWIYNAGLDPLEEMKRLRHRVSAIHIKDGFMGGEGVPLGRGTAPVKEVYYLAKELGYRIIVESETLTPDGLSEAKECISYLNSLEI